MKKAFATIAVLSISIFTIQAQTEKGTSLIGGAFSFSTAKGIRDYNPGVNSYRFSPKIGHFISSNFVVGTNLSVDYQKNETYKLPNVVSEQGGESRFGYGLAPFARYYLNITDRFKFFTEFELSWQTSKDKARIRENGPKENYRKIDHYAANLNPGLVFFPTKKWAIEMSFPLIGYGKNTTKPIGSATFEKTNDDSFNFGLSTINPLIGVNYHF